MLLTCLKNLILSIGSSTRWRDINLIAYVEGSRIFWWLVFEYKQVLFIFIKILMPILQSNVRIRHKVPWKLWSLWRCHEYKVGNHRIMLLHIILSIFYQFTLLSFLTCLHSLHRLSPGLSQVVTATFSPFLFT